MNLKRLQSICQAEGLEPFRVNQLAQAFFQKHCRTFGEITTLRKDLRERLEATQKILCATPIRRLDSADRRCIKTALQLHDDAVIETVLMETTPGLWTVCVSTQVGCAVGCPFCATGRQGLRRNLTSEEITDQVLYWRQLMAAERPDAIPRNLVFMGMGEPFHNARNVFFALSELTDPRAFGIGSRHISISTAGVLRPIRRLARDFNQVNLSISLHAANDEERTRLVPINRLYPLARLRDAINEYLEQTRRKLFLEYTVVAGQNDSPRHMDELLRFLRSLKPSHLLHVNFISCNPIVAGTRPPARAPRLQELEQTIQRAGFSATVRRSLGQDIAGACGQLAGEICAP